VLVKINESIAGLLNLFPDADYRHRMRFEQGTIHGFFGRTPDAGHLLDERGRWLDAEHEKYSALMPAGRDLVEEAASLLATAGVFDHPARQAATGSPPEILAQLGRALEPDFLLLKPDDAGTIHLLAGCVCFPSSWSLAEKMGRPLEFIHEVVPGLNDQLGTAIGSFLAKLTPGVAWLRSNWGLSRSPELNQHPDRNLPRLDANVGADEVWLRIENQALVRLPASNAVLFGIRIAVHPLPEVTKDPEVRRRLYRALETMPEPMARYKNLAAARPRLLELLAYDSAPMGATGDKLG